jgi:hypothetical protein
MFAIVASTAAIAAMIVDEFLNLLLACQFCGTGPPQEHLKEPDPLEDPLRPFIDRLYRGLCCRCHLNLYCMLLFPLYTNTAERSIIAVEGSTVKWG